MTNGENKRKYLQMIQDVITRMGSNSFLLKGWSISLITAVIGFALTADSDIERASLLSVAIILVVVFWLVDGFYLSQEKMYRSLYEDARKISEDSIDFSLDASCYKNVKGNSWFEALYSKPFLVFYAPALIILVLVCSNIISIDINIYLK